MRAGFPLSSNSQLSSASAHRCDRHRYLCDVDLQRRITSLHGEFLLFALTPPRLSTTPEKAQEIADITFERLEPLGVDGLILYDIDDETDRNPDERPFPFLPTMDPADYLDRHLKTWGTPVVVYRATAKYTEQELLDWMASQDTTKRMAVFVGASSREKRVATTLRRAQQLRTEANPDLLLGAVAIPERHTRNGEEHLRLTTKQEAGCSYFVTQVVYDVNAAKNLVSDYAYECHDRGLDPIPIVFTFSVCGSMQTLKFLRWLGVDVPRWIENDLRHAEDTLEASLEHADATALDLMSFCRRLGVPFGINVESVSIRRVEIEASVRLAERLRGMLVR
jgi:Methylenetetrahydrofolate reductase